MKFADLFTFSNYENETFYDCVLLKEISPQFKIGDNVRFIYYKPEEGTFQLGTDTHTFSVKIELSVTSIGNLETIK